MVVWESFWNVVNDLLRRCGCSIVLLRQNRAELRSHLSHRNDDKPPEGGYMWGVWCGYVSYDDFIGWLVVALLERPSESDVTESGEEGF